MTVRIFSQLPPDRIKRLWVDGESHTSVALAEILWQQIYDRVLTLETVNVRELDIGRLEAVLLIGDKVVDSRRAGFAYEVDLGGAWRQQTGLPFVFAVWACRRDRPPPPAAAEMLSRARDRGAGRAALIAETQGPGRGWPVALARRYLTRCLRYRLDARALEGANLFGRLCARCGFVPPQARIAWPQELSLETV